MNTIESNPTESSITRVGRGGWSTSLLGYSTGNSELCLLENGARMHFDEIGKPLGPDTKLNIILSHGNPSVGNARFMHPSIRYNLNTHSKKVLIEILGEKEGGKIARKIEWHFTPKHASWLDQAEIEIHSLEQQCLNRRIPDFHAMQSEVAACVQKRNQNKCRINWQFTRDKAKEKFKFS